MVMKGLLPEHVLIDYSPIGISHTFLSIFCMRFGDIDEVLVLYLIKLVLFHFGIGKMSITTSKTCTLWIYNTNSETPAVPCPLIIDKLFIIKY